MNQMLTGFWMMQAVSVITRLGVPEALAEGPRSVTEIATEVGAHAPTLDRVLRALTERGVVTWQNNEYALTPLGETLRRGTPGSLASLAVMLGSDWMVALRGGLYETVRTGRMTTVEVLGAGLFDYLHEHPRDAEIFNAAMVEVPGAASAAVAATYDFGRFATVVDVGGGRGYLLASILAAHPHLRGVVFDAAEVVAEAGPELERHGVTDRCEVAAGSFFEAVPAGADGYVLSNVLHDWDDEAALVILRAVAAAMTPDSTLLIIGWVLPDGPEPYPVGRVLDVQMLLVTDGGRERTEDEFHGLLEQAGLRLVTVLRDRPVLPTLLEVVLK
jgi:hypothetical protein